MTYAAALRTSGSGSRKKDCSPPTREKAKAVPLGSKPSKLRLLHDLIAPQHLPWHREWALIRRLPSNTGTVFILYV